MEFKQLLQGELKDNGSFLISREGPDSYSLRNFGNLVNNEISVENRNDVEVHKLLQTVSDELKIKLTDLQFITRNLWLINDREYEHNTRSSFLNYLPGHENQLHNSQIQTGNLVGYVNKKLGNINYSIAVSSRFGDNFLKHLIASSDGFLEVPKSGDAALSGLAEWLLIFLWKIKLNHAYRLGLPKQYVGKSEKTIPFRGNLNLNDEISNPEFIPPYDCTFREHSYDNWITRLIFNTFRLLKHKDLVQDCHKLRQEFNLATNGKRLPVRELLHVQSLKNPYFKEYNIVADLSRRIIAKDIADFSSDKDDFSAFFFDVSMLFEYFIRKIFIRNGCILEEKNKKGYRIPCGGRKKSFSNLFPDIIIKNDDGSFDIFDVKYKRFFFQDGVNLDDLYQLNTYVAHLLNYTNVNRCGFIYPIGENNAEFSGSQIIQEMQIAGRTIIFQILFFAIPDDGSINYSQKFNKNIQKFLREFTIP